MVDRSQLSAASCEFARTLGAGSPAQQILDHLVDRSAGALPDTSAGVMLIGGESKPRCFAASDAGALGCQRLQIEVGEGPCLTAFDSGEPVAVVDLPSEARFPALTTAAQAAGFGAVFAFPLRQGEQRLGALALYRGATGMLDPCTMSAAQAFADVAAACLTDAQAREHPTPNRSMSCPQLRVAKPRRRDEAGDTAERDLLARIATGDQAALGVLFDRIGPRVYGAIHRIVRDPAQAEEVTQEVMLEVWTNASRFDAVRGSPRSWIVTMARRRAIDRVRSEQASRDRTRWIGIRDQQAAFDEVPDQIILDEEHTEIAAALADLSGLQRQAIELAHFGGRTYREVAELLDTPLGTIKTRIRDGLLQLRMVVEASTDEERAGRSARLPSRTG